MTPEQIRDLRACGDNVATATALLRCFQHGCGQSFTPHEIGLAADGLREVLEVIYQLTFDTIGG
jgi:hypothetical protein